MNHGLTDQLESIRYSISPHAPPTRDLPSRNYLFFKDIVTRALSVTDLPAFVYT